MPEKTTQKEHGNALKRLPYKLRYAAVLCNKDCGITLAKVGGNVPKRD